MFSLIRVKNQFNKNYCFIFSDKVSTFQKVRKVKRAGVVACAQVTFKTAISKEFISWIAYAHKVLTASALKEIN